MNLSGHQSGEPAESDSPKSIYRLVPGERQVVWTLWFTYGAFYFCRTNLAVALPGIEAELGYDKVRMGIVLSALKIAYACGQFLNGQFAERLSARKMLAIGMLGSAGLNIAFGFGTSLYFFLFVWALNGYAQSLGWTPCVRVIGNWIPVHRRGKAVGIVGTGYQVTAGLSYLVSGASVWLMGWRGALLLPPTILVAAAVGMLFLLRETPEAHAANTNGVAETPRGSSNVPRIGFLESIRLTLTNPALWLLAISLGMLNACRYGFLDWGVSHLVAIDRAGMQREQIETALASNELTTEQRRRLQDLREQDLVQDDAQLAVKSAIADGLLPKREEERRRTSVLKSAVKYALLPIGAVLGSFLAGWATDRFFNSRRAPAICTLLVVLGCLTLVYDPIARTSFPGTMALLVAVGFCIYGPQVLLVGTAPADLARQGTAAAAAGFVNCFGYFGAAAAGDLLTGYLTTHYGWSVAIYTWAGWAFGAAVLSALLWNATGNDESRG
jgi:sugar phosphate permease